jgi:uncharacterized membrane protein YedE/YeeE
MKRTAALEKESNPTRDHLTLILFILFLAELVLLMIGMIFGRLIGYEWTFTACLWIGILLAGCFALIIAGNLLVILFHGVLLRVLKKDPRPAHPRPR